MNSIKKLLLKETESDIIFRLIDENEQKLDFPAHKIILRLTSSIFNELFTKEDKKNELIVQNVKPNVFKDFLKFIYEEEIDIKTNEETSQLLQLAQKYEVNSLADKCVDHLTKSLDTNTFLSIYPFTKLLTGAGRTKLLHKCLLLLDDNVETILKKREFVNAAPWIIEDILDRDSLNIDEIDVFKAVVLWAHFECVKRQLATTNDNVRKVLDRLFYKIRFLVMSSKELFDGLSGLLTNEERDCFLKYKRDKSFTLKDPWIVKVLTRERFMVNCDWVNLFGSDGKSFEVCRQKDVLYVAFSRNVVVTRLTFVVDVKWTETVIIRGSVWDLEQNLVHRWHVKRETEGKVAQEFRQVGVELSVAMEALKCYGLKVKCVKGKLCNAKGECNCLTVSAVSWSSAAGVGSENVPMVNFRSNTDLWARKDAQYNMYWRNHFQVAKPSEDNMDTVFQSVKYFILK